MKRNLKVTSSVLREKVYMGFVRHQIEYGAVIWEPRPPGGGGVLPYMSYIGMCRCEGYGFQRVYSRIGYRNQRVFGLK